MKYSVIVPCYNEGENIVCLVDKLQNCTGGYDVEYILVENGSKDNTREMLERECAGKSNFKITYVDVNKGYGYGLLSGLKKAEGDYVGWLHADLQVAPKEMLRFIKYLEKNNDGKKYYLKGRRKNRKRLDALFTMGMTLFETVIFQTFMNDICAMPVLFHRDLLKEFGMAPYDFSLDLFSYYKAKKCGYTLRRYPVVLETRKNGVSSWDKGLSSKIKQSIRIMKSSIKIRRGEQVL